VKISGKLFGFSPFHDSRQKIDLWSLLDSSQVPGSNSSLQTARPLNLVIRSCILFSNQAVPIDNWRRRKSARNGSHSGMIAQFPPENQGRKRIGNGTPDKLTRNHPSIVHPVVEESKCHPMRIKTVYALEWPVVAIKEVSSHVP
jgi:hypothetical protein